MALQLENTLTTSDLTPVFRKPSSLALEADVQREQYLPLLLSNERVETISKCFCASALLSLVYLTSDWKHRKHPGLEADPAVTPETTRQTDCMR